MRHTTRYGGGRNAPIGGWFIAPTDIGRRHLDYLISQFVEHYHEERPHQGIDNNLPVPEKRRLRKPPDESTISIASIGCKTRLGGLLKHYYRKAA